MVGHGHGRGDRVKSVRKPRQRAISGYWVPRRRSDDTPRHISRHEPGRTSGAGGSSAVGATLSATIRTMAALRPAAKPLHPEGVIVTGALERRGSAVSSGSAWLDEPGRDEVVVRVSRAIGLPDAVPDIHGLAVRVPTPAGVGDLLFASTGWGSSDASCSHSAAVRSPGR